jgi:hypothetical protein
LVSFFSSSFGAIVILHVILFLELLRTNDRSK